jgi:hypothetical protein
MNFIQFPKIPIEPVDKANVFGNFRAYNVNPYFMNNLALPLFYMVLYFILGYTAKVLQPRPSTAGWVWT